MPSDGIWIAIVTGIAGVLGGLIGAVASPIGKDWVARRDFDRQRGLEEANRRRDATEAADQRQREQIRHILADLADAMQHYEAEWRGLANYHAKTEALKAANRGWADARSLGDAQARTLVDSWKRTIDQADMAYRDGNKPPGHGDVHNTYTSAAEYVGSLLRQT